MLRKPNVIPQYNAMILSNSAESLMFRYAIQHILIPEIVENDDVSKPETRCTNSGFLKINSDISQLGK